MLGGGLPMTEQSASQANPADGKRVDAWCIRQCASPGQQKGID
jgi:hypothetical protein